jgi:hypothetical protein
MVVESQSLADCPNLSLPKLKTNALANSSGVSSESLAGAALPFGCKTYKP